jgi:sugar transferase (PEP-CTERM/EpsH1 system associated)
VRARSYNLIRSLSLRHEVVVATVWTSEKDRAALDALRSVCHDVQAVRLPVWRSLVNCVRAVPGPEPLQASYSWSPELAAKIAALQGKADVLHVEHLRGARYALHAQAAASTPPIVWDSVDCISYLFGQSVRARSDRLGRLVNRFELSRTRGYEGRLASQFDRVLITSAVDRDALLASVPAPERARGKGGVQVSIVPNGVDTGYFSPTDQARRPRTLVFSGKMSYHANVAAVDHLVKAVMPRVWARVPEAELVIVGQNPPRRVRALAADSPRVTVTGSVPDVRPYLRSAAAAVIPLVYGAGSQFKVLEAMGCGTPVVATPRAVGALDARPGRDVVVADEPESFADAVVGLLGDPERQREIGRAGRAYVEAHHQWSRIATRLEGIYDEVVAARSGRRLERAAG